jgi:hypothetical protein
MLRASSPLHSYRRRLKDIRLHSRFISLAFYYVPLVTSSRIAPLILGVATSKPSGQFEKGMLGLKASAIHLNAFKFGNPRLGKMGPAVKKGA